MSVVADSSFLSRTGISLTIRLTGIAINFVALAVLARTLSPEALGQYSFAVELIALLCVVAAFGFNMIAIRIIPDRLVQQDRAGFVRFVRAGLLASVLGSALFGALIYFTWGKNWLVEGIDEATIYVIIAVLLSFTLLRFMQEIMRGASRMVAAQIVEQVIWPVILLAIAIALYLQPETSTAVQNLLLVQAGAFGLATLVLWAASHRLSRGLSHPCGASDQRPRKWLVASLPLAFSSALLIFLKRGDLLALGIAGSASDVAFYTPASRYAAFMILGQAAASMAAAAAMRKSWYDHDMAELQRGVGQMAAISVAFSMPFLLLYLVFPSWFLGLFGEQFHIAANAMRILVIAQMVNCWTGPIATVVVACEQERAYAKLVAVSTIIMVALLAILVPRLGMEGAAFSTLASISFLNIVMGWHIWRKTGLRCWLDTTAIIAAFVAGKNLVGRLRKRVQG